MRGLRGIRTPIELYRALSAAKFEESAYRLLMNHIDTIKMRYLHNIDPKKPNIADAAESFLKTLSKIIADRRNRNVVKKIDVETAIMFNHYLQTRRNALYDNGDGEINIFKSSIRNPDEVYKLFPLMRLNSAEIDKIEEYKGKLTVFLKENTDLDDARINKLVSEICASIAYLATLISMNYNDLDVKLEHIEEAYSLFRLIAFRVPRLDFETIYDLNRILVCSIYPKMREIKFDESILENAKKSLVENVTLSQINLEKIINRIISGLIGLALIYYARLSKFNDVEAFNEILVVFRNLISRILKKPYEEIKEKFFAHIANTEASFSANTAIVNLRSWITKAIILHLAHDQDVIEYSNIIFQQVQLILLISYILSFRERIQLVTLRTVKKAVRVYTYLMFDADLLRFTQPLTGD
ncbi:MAG: hypothetical protein ACTSSJ_06940 [Candidatus Odinarchaeia archaeon]